MPTYVGFLRFTQQGIQNIKDSPNRVQAARQAIEAAGGKMEAFYYTMGQYDAITIIEAPDDATVSRLVLGVAAQGNARLETARAFSADEMRDILSGLP